MMTRENAWTIIGVVQDAKYTQVRGPLPNIVYRLAAANPGDVLANLELRTALPLDERMPRGLANDQLVTNLTAIFGGIALLLACLGLYGTISYGVGRRIRELGVRMALGAARNRVLWLVMREAMILILAGAIVGLPLAYAAGRGIGSLLFWVGPLDAIAYATAAGLLLLVGGFAAFNPAHRASRIDPMAALCAE